MQKSLKEFFSVQIGYECTLDHAPLPDVMSRMSPMFRLCGAYTFPIPLSLYNTDCVPLKIIFHLSSTNITLGPKFG